MSNKLATLRDGLVHEVRDLFNAERQLLKALPKMEKRASNEKLKEAFHAHFLETEGQVARLEEIGQLLDEKVSGRTCKAMQGLIEEGSEIMEEECENCALIDALLIGAAQRVEHYEMAAYSAAHAMAVELGQDEVAGLLEETLEEETNADKMLSSIASDEVLSQANFGSNMDDEQRDARPAAGQKSQNQRRGGNAARALGIVACLVLTHPLGTVAFADSERSRIENEAEATKYKSDSTGSNVRDRNASRVTADDQKMGGPEMEVVASIRREIVANDNLSTNAHNVKIVVEKGQVLLRGPVKSAEEQAWIQDAAARVARGYSVVNQLGVSPG